MRALLRAKREAQAILEKSRVSSVPVPVEKIAKGYAQAIIRRPMQNDISGMLVPVGGIKPWVIVVNEFDPPVRQRFTIAHELGHLILHGYTTPHADSSFKLRYRDTRSSDGSVLEEMEANQFAAELLMPERLLVKTLQKEGIEYSPGLDGGDDNRIAELAKKFGVSQQALLIRISRIFA